MKGKKKLLMRIIFSVFVGGAMGFFLLPWITQDVSFILGFIACLVCTSLALILLLAWNRSPLIKRIFGKELPKASRSQLMSWIGLSFFIILGGLLISTLIFQQQERFESQIQYQTHTQNHQHEMLEASRTQKLVVLMSSLLEKVDAELETNPERALKSGTIARIAILSDALKPYGYLEGDSLYGDGYSLERGQLLQILLSMQIDSSSFDSIRAKTSFWGADLRGADLRMARLNGIRLKGANLQNADLEGAYLEDSDLRGVNLWGAHVKKAHLNKANLKRADLSWANLNDAELQEADLNGAILTSAQLRRVNLREAKLQWAKLNSAFLNEANLTKANLLWASMKSINLTQTILLDANLRYANLSEGIFTNTDFRGADLKKAVTEEGSWIEQLEAWRVMGSEEIQENYILVDDNSGRSNFRIEKRED